MDARETRATPVAFHSDISLIFPPLSQSLMREREGRGRRVVPTALKLLRRERRDGAKQGILKRNKGRGRKSDKTVPDCLRVAGISFFFMMQLLLYSSTTGQKQKQIDIFFADNMNEKRRTKISDETSVQLLLQPLLMGVCIHPSIHSSVEPFTHNYVNYIPLQCHMFAVTSHTTTENNEQTERQK